MIERELTGELQGIAIGEATTNGVGLLVLAGSSGRVDVGRARLFADHGALALALRYFGGPGQSPGICEVPLETLTRAVDWLIAEGAQRIGVVGLSKGAEAALLLACHDPRVNAVVAISPSSVVWANVGPGLDGQVYPYRSSWTWQGAPLPFVPYLDSWQGPSGDGPVAFRALYAESLAANPEAADRAAIPVERTRANILLVAGGDDQMWPSLDFATNLAARRQRSGLPVEIISNPDAGHRPILPGEEPLPPSPRYLYGGTPEADAALGAAAWPRLLACLGLE